MGQEIYALENKTLNDFSVFLAGPTPRDKSIASWRPDMVKALRDARFGGDILIPEKRGNFLDYQYDKQTMWEVKHLNAADLILFWIPRDLQTMPGYTTNIEFGEFLHSGKIVLGYPVGAPKMRYLQVRAETNKIPIFHSIEETAEYASKVYLKMYPREKINSIKQ